MNAVEYFVEFYNGLSTPGLLLFWSIITLFLFLIFSVIALLIKNNNLINYINSHQENSEKNLLEKDNNLDLAIRSEEEAPKIQEAGEYQTVNEALNVNKADVTENNDLYKKNILNEVGTKNQTSPINISKPSIDETMESIKKTMAMPLDFEEKQEESNFIDDISIEVENQIEQKPIELSEYETKQEEEAIISYEELKKNAKLAETREERYKIDVEDDNDFLSELKKFRQNLE